MSHENNKKHGHKKVIVCFYNLGEENFLKVAASVVFLTSIMVLPEIHQRFKGHFLNKLCVSFNVETNEIAYKEKTLNKTSAMLPISEWNLRYVF